MGSTKGAGLTLLVVGSILGLIAQFWTIFVIILQGWEIFTEFLIVTPSIIAWILLLIGFTQFKNDYTKQSSPTGYTAAPTPVPEMRVSARFCPKCGKQIPTDAQFCPFCGWQPEAQKRK
jgi:hypothetical protein